MALKARTTRQPIACFNKRKPATQTGIPSAKADMDNVNTADIIAPLSPHDTHVLTQTVVNKKSNTSPFADRNTYLTKRKSELRNSGTISETNFRTKSIFITKHFSNQQFFEKDRVSRGNPYAIGAFTKGK